MSASGPSGSFGAFCFSAEDGNSFPPKRGAQLERIEKMITPGELFGEATKYVASAAIGWLIANLNTQRKFDDFEKKAITPLRDKIAVFEGATAQYITRAELKSEMEHLRGDFKEGINEVKTLIHDLLMKR
jgi:hypothetical protein